MTDLTVALRFRTDRTGLVGGLNATKEDLRQLGAAGDQAGARTASSFGVAERSTRSLRDQVFSLRGALVGLGLEEAGRAVLRNADSYTQLDGRIKLVTKSSAEQLQVSRSLFQVAQDTRSEYEATVSLYARMARSSGDLANNQRDLRDLTRAVNQTFKISSASVSEAAAGVQQFGQALQSGVFQGDELRSVAENAPRLFDAIIAGIQKVNPALEVTKANFRDLASKGVITADLITAALLNQKDVIAAEFALLPQTIRETWLTVVQEAERALASGNFDAVVDGLKELRAQIAAPEMQQALAGLGASVATVASGAVTLLGILADNRVAIFTAALVLGAGALGRFSGQLGDNVAKSVRAEAAQNQLNATNAAGTTLWASLARATAADTAADVENTRATLSAVSAARAENIQRLNLANAKLASARATLQETAASLAAGNVVQRTLQGTVLHAAALRERSAAMAELAVLGQQQARLEATLTQAVNANTLAQQRARAAGVASGAAIEGVGIASRAAAAGATVLRGALAFFGGWVGVAVAGLSALYFWWQQNESAAAAADAKFWESAKSLDELVAAKQRAARGEPIFSDEDKQAIEAGQEEIRGLAAAMAALAVSRDLVLAQGDSAGAARVEGDMAKVAARIKEISDKLRIVMDTSKPAVKAVDTISDAVKRANENALEQIRTMERVEELIRSGMSADLAAAKAKLELDGVNKATIDTLIGKMAAQKRAAEIDEEAAKAQEDLARAEIDTRNAAIARQDAMKPELDDLRAVLEMVERGGEIEASRYNIQLRRLEATEAELRAKGLVLDADNVAAEAEKLRVQRQLDAIGATRDAEREALQRITADAEKAADQINEALTDSLMRAFENGESFGKAFFSSLEATAKTMVLKPTIKFLLEPLSQIVSSVFSGGLGGAAGGTGGASSLLGMLGMGGGAGSLLDKIIVSGDSVDRLLAGQLTGANLAGALPAAGAVAGAGFGLYQIGSSLARSDSAISGRNQGLANLLTFGNSSVLSGLDNLTGGNIFGTKWRTSDSGLVLDYAGGDLAAQTFENQKKKRSLGRGTKRRTRYNDLDDGSETAIDAEFDAFLSSLSMVADQLGLNADAVDNYTATLRISTQDLDPEEAQKAIVDALRAEFSGLTDQVIPFLAEFALQGEETADTLLRVGGNLQVVNASLKTLGLTLDGISGQSLVELTEGLVDLFDGDAGALATAAGAFYDAFTSDAQKFADLGAALAAQLGDVNMELPTTRDQFADLRNAMDLTTEGGREALATLLRLSSQADAYYTELERQAVAAAEAQQRIGADALSEQSTALKGSEGEFKDAVKAFRDGFDDIADALKATLASIAAVRGGIAQSALAIRQTAPGFSSLDYQKGLIGTLRGQLNEGSIDDRVGTVDKLQQAIAQRYQLEFDAINKARQADVDRYNAQMQQADAMRQALQNLKGFVDGLKLGDLTILRPGEQLAEAKAQYGRALMAAQSGTDPAAVQNLQGAAQTYLEQARGYFGSDERYQDIFRSTLAETSRVGGRSVSVLPPNTGYYDQAISETQAAALDELDALQDQLDELQEQANELFIDSFATLNATLQAQTDAITATMQATTQAVMDRVGGAVDAAAQQAQQAAIQAIAATQRTAADVRAELRAVGAQIASSVSSVAASVAYTRNVA